MRTSRKLAALAAFFVVGALVAGCGSSNGLGNSAATVAGNPISVQAVNHWMYIAAKDQAAEAAQEGETEPVITAPDPPKFADCIKQVRASVTSLAKTAASTLRSDCKQVFTEYSGEVMAYLIEGYWYQADADKLGITYSNAAVNRQIAKIKKASFKTEAAFLTYLKQSGETLDDLKFQIRVNEIYGKLLAHYEKKVTTAQIDAYYKAHKASFASAATVSGHLIRVKTQANAQAAASALKAGTSWPTVAKKYGEAATDGGVISDVTANEYEHAANTALFSAPLNKVVGPVKGIFGYYVLEVSKSTKAVQMTLAQEAKTIKTELAADAKTAAEDKVTAYSKKYFGKQTICNATYQVSDCANYKAPKTTTSAASATSSGSSASTTTAATSSTAKTSSTSTTATTSSTASTTTAG